MERGIRVLDVACRIREARGADAATLQAAVAAIAELELATRGAGELSAETAATLTLLAVTG